MACGRGEKVGRLELHIEPSALVMALVGPSTR